ncbi:MAG TPA: Gfo/Idh/MocA family oxidoreductase [Phototrophicaceae bacterium]|jgi:predicted dehydrogenase|nr:Gfo/Idh/MocA family oxidoreductase [Phototrophicaceae bacterium]
MTTKSIKIAAVGFAHNHIYNMINALVNAGAEFVTYYETDPDRIAEVVERYPHIPLAASLEAILDDPTIDLVVSATIPNERAPLGIQVMEHGKDYLCAKPGLVSLEQLAEVRRIQAATGQIYAIYYGERLGSPATVKAGELVQTGAIGQVIQTVGFGPHRLLNHGYRPDWTFDSQYFGGVINDLASHQMDQFLYFTGSTSAEVVAAHVGNFRHTQFPLIHDYGDVTIRSPHASGYVRVDWLTPMGLQSWGDVRLFIQGTEGYIELRKNIDLAGRPGNNHLYLVNQTTTEYIDCANVALPYAAQLIQDVLHRTETAMTQTHCFLASELALQAEVIALDLTAKQVTDAR